MVPVIPKWAVLIAFLLIWDLNDATGDKRFEPYEILGVHRRASQQVLQLGHIFLN